ncbi:Ulp1 protease family, C-terminal catalytic domain-containing protein [Toxoplasma gondii TgCatPRC2]|uniref:Ulp1 protease family, C-terminal catalytic domain-containing protein n=2 Tax=Toxoplasma gondii TaxID=5811 RepID=A0A151H601_TOXGO|nr:Ulp1 protease family, C-terminal catalytic domain-containing protein [Toxoplasma gondii ARI]KYK64742.1 Ulp1 protease family, C-terminal catalytic domain-containing protein [Toxoplasma gondii TgCatPRC2]
MLQLCQTYVA